jgi:hypothetical protein
MRTLLLTAVAISSPAGAGPRHSPEVQLQKLLEGRVPGRPTDCINLRSVSSSQIIDRTAIVYRVGGTLYVNQPHSGASSLRRDDFLLTRTHSSQLCSIDLVRLLDHGSHFPRGFVGLGKFVPYSRAKLTS